MGNTWDKRDTRSCGYRYNSSGQFSSVQLQNGMYVLRKVHIHALHPVSQKFPQRCLWNGSSVHLIDDGPLSSFQGRSSRASCFHASLLQAIDWVMSSALCPQVVSQASQHFRSSEKQATYEGCFARQSVCSVISLHSNHVHKTKFPVKLASRFFQQTESSQLSCL